MITRTKAYALEDGRTFEKLEDAQRAALAALFRSKSGESDITIEDLFLNGAELIDILTTTERSLPRARKINGGRKRRAGGASVTAASAAPSGGPA